VDIDEKVLERMGTTEGVTLVLKREVEGKIRVTSNLWEEAKVLLRGEMLEVRTSREGSISPGSPADRTNGTRPLSPMTLWPGQRNRR
jgi:hypothetical protein